jgi:hypothetical protein
MSDGGFFAWPTRGPMAMAWLAQCAVRVSVFFSSILPGVFLSIVLQYTVQGNHSVSAFRNNTSK